jgi:hypothetical protein
MAEMATYIGIEPRTGTASLASGGIARGLRVLFNASSTLDLQDITARGDFVTIQALEANPPGKPGEIASAWGGGKVPAVASVLTNPGDPAYTAASGQFSNVSTGAILVGKWIVGASGAGVLGEVELE